MSQIIFKSSYPSKVYPEITVHEYVLDKMKKYSDKVAFIDYDTKISLTYKNILDYVELFSQNLSQVFGAKKSDVFAVYLPNHVFFPVITYGVLTAGAIMTTLNPLYTDAEVHKQLMDSNAKWIVTFPQNLENTKKAAIDSSITKIFVLSADPVDTTMDGNVEILDFKTLLQPIESKNLGLKWDPKEDIAFLPYSSGTTGISKGVMLTHYNFISNIIQGNFEKAIVDEGETLIGVLPFFHVYALYAILGIAPTKGCTVVVLARFDLVKFLTIVQEFQVKRLHIVPPIVLALAKHPIVDKFDLSSLKSIISAAAPLSTELTIECQKRLKISVKQAYGMTESSPLVCAQLDGEEVHGGSGTLIPDEEARIVDPETGKDLETGHEGELVLRGPNIMKGYLGNDVATKFTIRDGWLFTGDVARIDSKGQIFIVDRVKELIKYKGFQVPPAELEAILLTHPAVADCCVIGVADVECGEIPKAYIVLKPDMKHSPDDFMEYVENKVSPQKKIRLVEFIDAIPKAASGKILRRILRDLNKK
jgi:acyl-CoA synthetase (AMP-forming)/AMP-acid ligase II